MSGFTITSISFSYPAVSSEERALLATRLRSAKIALTLLSQHGVTAFLLSTCLRLELVVSGSAEKLGEAVRVVFGDMALPSGKVQREGSIAVEHLFRIVGGLESPVIGEREILVQFRQAVTDAIDHGGADGPFIGLFGAAIATARAVRTELPEDPQRSMAAIAADLVGTADRVAVFGYGAMGRALTEAILDLDHEPAVAVYVRRPELVVDDRVSVHPLNEAALAVSDSPAVISATSAKTRILPTDELRRALSRRTHPLTLIDMAMPPDFSPDEGALVNYFDIDHLASLARTHIVRDGADRLVAEAADEFMRKAVSGQRTGQVIKHIFEHADEVVNDVVSRLAGKLTAPGDRELLTQAAHSAVRKVLDRPVRYVAGEGTDHVGAIAAAFGVSPDA